MHGPVYPLQGYESNGHDLRDGMDMQAWRSIRNDRRIVSLDGTPVHAQVLPNTQPGPHQGEWIILCCGNGVTYEVYPLDAFLDLRNAGYSILVYHPPQYGTTKGPRTLRSDLLAGEAMVEYLLEHLGVREDAIHVIGHSIGSGVGVHLMRLYNLGKSVLVCPLANFDTIARRYISYFLPGHTWLTALVSWAVSGVARDYLGYDNAAKMAQLRTREVVIHQGLDDTIMGQGVEVDGTEREAASLIKGWRSSRGNPAAVEDTRHHTVLVQGDGPESPPQEQVINIPQVTYNGLDGQRLTLVSWAMGHQVPTEVAHIDLTS